MKRRVLITRLSALGDVAMSLPVVYAVCRLNPDADFIMLTRPHPARLFIDTPSNLTVLTPDLKEYKGIGGMYKLFKEIDSRYDITDFVDLHDVLRTKIMRNIANLKDVRVSKIEKGRCAKKALTRRFRKRFKPIMTTPERYIDTFRKAGLKVPGDLETPVYRPLLSAKQSSILGADDTIRYAVAPFAAHAGKMYPLSQMRKVVEILARRENTIVYIFGFGDEETAKIDTLAQGYSNVVNMARLHLSAGDELALLSQCSCMVSMDSANMHLASLVGLRTVSIWGATHPYAGFMGIGQNALDAVQCDMRCRPCSVYGNRKCRFGTYPCLTEISAETIINRIDRIYENKE